jgi:3-hydroxymyristoyl/3-hydroxydecanoyl-(acyl carrier protein) dehydratase
LREVGELDAIGHRFSLDGGFPADSPFLDGHFPGNPIVPGAVILGYLAARLAEVDLAIARVTRMKFLRLLRPDVPMEITLVVKGRGDRPEVRAEFRDAEGIVASASLVLRGRDD